MPKPMSGSTEMHPVEPAPPMPVPYGDRPAPLWLHRFSLFVLVLFCVQLGVIVTWVPWWQAVWDQNPLLLAHPKVLEILKLGPVRGVISGCGLLDIWIGISEAIHYRESPRR